MAILNPYLNFNGSAREAMEFYRDVFGGELNVMTFGDMGSQGGEHEAPADGVMHAQLTSDLGFTLMGADTPPGMGEAGSNGQVSLSGDEGDALRGYFDKLADGGQVTVPIEKQVWGDEFGMCVDRFGVTWLVNISGQQQ
ncbi:MAG TPA: VOC family protein [Nocardioides sp.]|uniref:VOC family protein n=1 Tax=Nocardioides sp. TaxID=35761 RepID=UPI002E3235D3|nr:VOC family protein [Nocardioides sp.]HEX5087130.1 VOC family protein [Nocardioides sp.]